MSRIYKITPRNSRLNHLGSRPVWSVDHRGHRTVPSSVGAAATTALKVEAALTTADTLAQVVSVRVYLAFISAAEMEMSA